MCRMATLKIGPFFGWMEHSCHCYFFYPKFAEFAPFWKVGLEFESIFSRNAREVVFSPSVPVDLANTGAWHLRRDLSWKTL